MAREEAGSSESVDFELKDVGYFFCALIGLSHGLAKGTATFEDYPLDLFWLDLERSGRISSFALVGFLGPFVLPGHLYPNIEGWKLTALLYSNKQNYQTFSKHLAPNDIGRRFNAIQIRYSKSTEAAARLRP